jgi:FkbM family methyltransferase
VTGTVTYRDPGARRAALCARHDITLVLDVGANAGQYASRLRAAGYRGRIVSFEPVTEPFEELQRAAQDDPLWFPMRIALGERRGPGSLQVSQTTLASSFLRMRPRHVHLLPESRVVRTEVVDVVTLDAVWDQIVDWTDRVYLKLDVQGFELSVLCGAARSLRDIVLLEAELSLQALYYDAPSYDRVVGYLDEAGYRLVSLCEGPEDAQTGEMLEFDGIFLNRRSVT